jgi:hypothetical protein
MICELGLALLQSYLRELPSPLFGEGLYADWLEAGNLSVYMPFIRYAVLLSIFRISLSANRCFGSALVSVRIRIQLFTSIQIQGAKPMRIRIRIRILVRLCCHKKMDFDMKNILYVGITS